MILLYSTLPTLLYPTLLYPTLQDPREMILARRAKSGSFYAREFFLIIGFGDEVAKQVRAVV